MNPNLAACLIMLGLFLVIPTLGCFLHWLNVREASRRETLRLEYEARVADPELRRRRDYIDEMLKKDENHAERTEA